MRRINPDHSHFVATRGGRRLVTTNSAVVRRVAAALGFVLIELEW